MEAAAAALVHSSLAPLSLLLIFYSSLRRKVTLLVINFALKGHGLFATLLHAASSNDELFVVPTQVW